MKEQYRIFFSIFIGVFLSLILLDIFSSPVAAGPIPQGDTQVSPLNRLNVSMGIQYRVMYNYSNIPMTRSDGTVVTSFTDAHSYDFFRQRLRLNIEMQPAENVGGFAQLEFRGGWGGSSPLDSDPREGDPTVNPFNRLQARGVRYGYLYVTKQEHTLAVGILPASDQVGDTLFSADWDFNVGGIAYVAKAKGVPVDYRLAYLRLVDTVNSVVKSDLTRDGHIYVGDVNFGRNALKVGAHVYYLYIGGRLADSGADTVLQAGKTEEGWYGLTAAGDFGPAALNGFFILNNGRTAGSPTHTGFAVKGEGSLLLGPARGNLLFIYTTGDKEGDPVDDQFSTVQAMVGTQGYWAYTHLFTANGPSDVNDLGVRIDNGGRGLLTIQGKLSAPLIERLSGDMVVGYFQAAEDNAAGNKDMGTEVAGMLTLEVAKNLNLQVGAAGAFLGDFFATDADDLYEAFSRFQLQF